MQPDDMRKAAALLRRGALVAFPTETVYGLGAHACDDRAVAAVFSAKGRPAFNPLIVHVADVAIAQRLARWSDAAEELAARFWPGPLTLVLPLIQQSGLSPLVTANTQTVALRVPDHPTAQALLAAFDGPIAAPSANRSGQISPTTASHVMAGLGNRISAVIDDGPCRVGLESTIVGLVDNPQLLRAGGLPATEIEEALGTPLAARSQGPITAPGQLTSHYAPQAAVRLNVQEPHPGELYLGFGPMACDLNLSRGGDLTEAAANLFDALHHLDAQGKTIAVAPIPQTGLGVAINDRLARAAAPR